MKIYETQIIDYFIGCFDAKKMKCNDVGFNFKEFEREFIYRLAKETYWEGDGEVLFFPIFPNNNDCAFDYGAIIKQQNNGDTWVAIPNHVKIYTLDISECCRLVTDTKSYKKYYQEPNKQIGCGW